MKSKLGCKSVKRGRVSLVLAMSLTAVVAATTSAEGQTYKVIHTFTSGKDGIEPDAGVLLAPDGIYGTTYSGGGSSDTGTVFKIDKTGKETVVERFPGCCGIYSQGGGPEGDMVRDAAGNLYGTTSYGGSGGGSNWGNSGCGPLVKLGTADTATGH